MWWRPWPNPGQKTAHVYAGEFVIPASSGTGLTKDTKFDLMNTHALPFDSDWFGAAPNSRPQHPRRGKLDVQNMEIKRRLHAAIVEAVRLQREQQAPGE